MNVDETKESRDMEELVMVTIAKHLCVLNKIKSILKFEIKKKKKQS